MDVLSPAGSGLCCDECGYPRTGLVDGARCPECGAAAPETVGVRVSEGSGPSEVVRDVVVTRGELLWLRTTALGLALLLYWSYHALRVALIMGVGAASLSAVNVPGPKVGMAQMLQRSLGGPPGPWGVDGTMAALGGVLAVWLLTRRWAGVGASEGFVSVRLAARWSAVVGVGAILGSQLAQVPLLQVEALQSFWGSDEMSAVAIALLIGELPANTLLYAHLYGVAGAVGDRRARAYLRAAMVLVPLTLVGALGAAAYMMFVAKRIGYEKEPARLNATAMVAYGTAAVMVGAVATAGVCRLLTTVAARAFGGLGVRARRALGRLPAVGQRLAAGVRRDPGRWPVVAGVAWWLWLLPSLHAESMTAFERVGMGRLPMLNFAGPKVQLFPVLTSLSTSGAVAVSSFAVDVGSLVALWALTAAGSVRPAGGAADRLRGIARWLPVLLAGAVVGLALSLRAEGAGRFPRVSWVMAACVALVEGPATVLLYLHLANVAAHRAFAGLARTLRYVACAAGLLIAGPLIAFGLTDSVKAYRFTPAVGWLSAAYGAATVAGAFVAVGAVARLGWVVATQRENCDRVC